jgi:hypothetical protein
MTDEEGYAEQWPRTGMRLLCWFGRHDWYHLDHFPDGDPFPPGYIARRCKRCGKVQWALQRDLRLNGSDPHYNFWVNGWPRRSTTQHNPPFTGPLSEPEVTVLHPLEPGLTQEEQGLP